MGVPSRVRRLSTPLGLALALAVAGLNSTVTGSDGEPSRLETSAATEQEPAAVTSDAQEAPASVTAVAPTQPLAPAQPLQPLAPTQPFSYKPAVHIASSGPAIAPTA